MRSRSAGPLLFAVLASFAQGPHTARAAADVPATWGMGSLGSPILPGLIVLRTAGRSEIFTGGSLTTFGPADYWYVLRPDPATGRLEQVFSSERMPTPIRRMAAADVSGDNALELVVGLETSGEIRVYDAQSRRLLYAFTTPLNFSTLTLHDLDSDGKAEILVAAGTGLVVYSGTGSVLWSLMEAWGSELVVAQMDDDPSLEIATTNGEVVDVAGQTVQWNAPFFFGDQLRAADIDGDGRDELFMSFQSQHLLQAYDVETQTPKWDYVHGPEIATFEIVDTDCDGSLELLIGSVLPLVALDPSTRLEMWHLSSAGGNGAIAVADMDGNGYPDIVLEAGSTSSAPDDLLVADGVTKAIQWRSTNLTGPFLGPEAGDVDGDGHPEIVFASTESDQHLSAGRIVVLDGRTRRIRAIAPADPALNTVNDLKLRNIDADPELEILLATDAFHGGRIVIYDYDGVTNTIVQQWTSPVGVFTPPFSAVGVADVDLDGELEVVGGGMRGSTGDEGVFVYVYPFPSVEFEWRSPSSLGPYWAKIRDVVVATAGGGSPDILAIVDGESLYGFDGVTKAPLPTITGAFTVLRADPFAAVRSIYLGDTTGNVYRLERGPTQYDLVGTFALGPGAIDGITPLPGGEFLIGSGGVLRFYPALDAFPIWQSLGYGAPFGRSVCRGEGRHARYFSAGLYGASELAPGVDLASVSPSSGPATGGTVLTATGTLFQVGASVFLENDAATDVVVEGATLQATTPSLPPGSLQTVTVLNPDGSFEALDNAFFADFLDVDETHPIHGYVETIFRRRVTAGCGAGNFCAAQPVTRAQMAAFLVRAQFGAGFQTPQAHGLLFSDVACGGFAANEIEWIANVGVTAGCGGGAYCGSSPVTRAQMAVFLLKTVEGSDYAPPPAKGIFADVPAADPFAPWIEELSSRNITAGCGGGNYCPGDTTTRGQMAVFLSLTFFGP